MLRIIQLNTVMKDTESVEKVIIFNGHKVLMMSRHDNKQWELPGGHLNFGEKFKDAAKREVFEETGIKLKRMKVVLKQPKFVMFVATTNIAQIKLSDEHVDYRWVTDKGFKRLKISQSTRLNVKTIQRVISR